MATKNYTLLPVEHRPTQACQWDSKTWQNIPFLEISEFRPESSPHRPQTRVKLIHTPDGICGLFQVTDNYVRCLRTQFQDEVYKDSCVEFFVQPNSNSGYFNFEFNCGGTVLASYITDPTRTENGFKNFTLLTPEDGQLIEVSHSMPKIVDTEIQKETRWYLEFFIPFSLIEKYAGPLKGKSWRANFYKCADESSHPHWGAWSPVDELNFHLPRCFGTIDFS